MCHAPIVVPEVGGERAPECARTTQAMSAAAARLLAHRPDVIAIVSPHAPRDPTRFGVCSDRLLQGTFGKFGVPEVEVRLPGAPDLAGALRRSADAEGLSTCELSGRGLDHGALVPLYFVRKVGWTGPTLLLSLPYPGTETEPAMGRALASAAEHVGLRVCVLASGDMSHRLTPGAPAGYHPQARAFDERFRELIARGELEDAVTIDATLRELAAEDVVDSCAVAAGAVDFDATGHRVLQYEGPFGVGYLEAVLHERAGAAGVRSGEPEDPGASASPPPELLSIARASIAANLLGKRYRPPALRAPWRSSRGVFVTLRNSGGELRGCIGHVEPMYVTLAQELAACAAASATRDTRFSPVRLDELEQLRIEISLLGSPEAVTSIAQLDPARYGVVVSAGLQRGVLLPGIDGIHTALEQVRIAAAKAGLSLGAPLDLQRFEVIKLVEQSGSCTIDAGARRSRGVHGPN
jgi:AmmeMemoRadiSam system protein A